MPLSLFKPLDSKNVFKDVFGHLYKGVCIYSQSAHSKLSGSGASLEFSVIIASKILSVDDTGHHADTYE